MAIAPPYVPPNSGPGSLIGNRFPTGPEPEQPMGQSGVSILMDLIRKLMEDGDYQGLSQVLPQMYPEPAPDELGAPPGPVLPSPEEELAPADTMDMLGEDYGGGDVGEYGGLLPEELGGLVGQAPPSGGSWPEYPLNEGPNVGQYNNPSVSELPGILAGPQDAGFAPAPPIGDAGFAPAPLGLPGDQGMTPTPPLFGPGGFTGAPPDMRQPGPQGELPPWILELLGLQPGMGLGPQM
jgi:hypothetical protein